MVFMQQARAGNEICLRAIVLDQIGDMADEPLHGNPGPGRKTRVEERVLLLESSLAATFASHPKPFRSASLRLEQEREQVEEEMSVEWRKKSGTSINKTTTPRS
jgi:hypothetical protein